MELHVTDIRQFAGCRVRWWFSSPAALNLRPNLPPSALFMGKLFHRGAEVLHRCLATGAIPYDDAVGAAMEAVAMQANKTFDSESFRFSADHKPTSFYADDVELVADMVYNYGLWLKYQDWEFEIDNIERTLHTRLPTPKGNASHCIISTKPDAVIIDEKGRRWLLELKTAGRKYGLSPDLDIDIQMGTYVWAANIHGLDVRGVKRLVAYKTTPRKPELVQDGSRLSRRKITTTYELLLAAIEEYGLNPDDYRDWLGELQGAEHPCFSVSDHYRTPKEVSILLGRLYRMYKAIRRTQIYSNEGPLCKWCAFAEPCKALHQGTDYGWMLQEDFHARSEEDD